MQSMFQGKTGSTAAATAATASSAHLGRPPFPSYTGNLESNGLTFAADLAIKWEDTKEAKHALWDINLALETNKHYISDLTNKRNELIAWLAQKEAATHPTDASTSLLSAGKSADQQQWSVARQAAHQAGAASSDLQVLADAAIVPDSKGGICYLARMAGAGQCHFSGKEKGMFNDNPDTAYCLLAAAKVGCCSCICELINQGVSVHSTTKTDGWGVWDQAHHYTKANQSVLKCIEEAGGRATEVYKAYLLRQERKSRLSASY